MRQKLSPAVLTLAALALAAPLVAAEAASSRRTPWPESAFEGMRWRELGPYRGGRSAAVAGVPAQPLVYYFGATGGGVWKTVDGGQSWKCVSDGFFGGSIGAVAVAESDPSVVYVGGGEKTVRGNVSHGDGMWKSMDGGASWRSIGLADSRHISRIRVHPNNPDLLYVAVMGHAFGPNKERGVYRSRDGGGSWERILFAGEHAGAVDLVLDPTNARVLYASTWRMRRLPWGFESGGPGSALWKSTDGGDTWVELSRNEGMPRGTLGIIGVTVSHRNPANLYAIVEAEEGGVFRSRDGGRTWEKTNDSRDLRQRAWYYTRINADPEDEDTVYVLNVRFHKSKDGGKTFTTIPTPHGDNHDLWIDPNDSRRMVEANDGGANVTTDGGETWTAQDNQPTAQIYRVSTDNDFPWRALGAQQDNSALRIRHRSSGPGIGRLDWDVTAGGESGHIVAHPKDPDLVFGGSYGGYLTMLNHRTREFRDVNPWPDNPMGWGAAELTERFQWNFPILFSPHDPDTLYAASQHLFRSIDRGGSWTRISGDLTRNDKTKMGPSGGPITKDNTSVEYYGTVFAVAESPVEKGVLWAGSDDGLVHLTRDGGGTWVNVTPPRALMPEWILVNSIEASPTERGAAYVAATMYKWDDFRPYLYKTADYGKTWTKIVEGIADDHFTRVVRADPTRRGLLYAGTERGVYVSFDDGGRWQPLPLELPIVPVTDLAVKEGDLVAATQGRGFWVLDDLSPLRQLSAEALQKAVHLYQPRPAWRMQAFTARRAPTNQGTNPPAGVLLYYHVKDAPVGTKVKLEFLGDGGKTIRELQGEVVAEKEKPEPRKMADGVPADKGGEPPAGKEDEERDRAERRREESKLPDVRHGLNRFAWDLRHAEAEKFDGLILWGDDGLGGPRVPPGTYTARLTVGDLPPASTTFEVRTDPRSSATPADLAAQYEFLLAIHGTLSEAHREIGRIREVRKQLDGIKARAKGDAKHEPVVEAATALDEKMTAVEEALYQTKNRSRQDPLNFPIRLNDKLALLADSASTGDFAPTAQARAVGERLTAAIDAELAKLREVWREDLPAFNRRAAELALPAVAVKTN